MAKLVIGSNKQNGVPAIVKEVGVQPSLGTKNIVANGTYNASSDNYDGYSSVTVNVPASTVSEPYLEYEIAQISSTSSVIRPSRTTSHLIPLSGFTTIDSYCFARAYLYNTAISGTATFTDLKDIATEYSCYFMFSNSTITGISCPVLTSVTGNYAMAYIASDSQVSMFNFPLLQTVGSTAFSRAFANCTNLTTGVFPALNSIKSSGVFSNTFAGCVNLASLSFPALKSNSFGSYTNQFNNMLSGVTGCTVHFPSNLQSVIGSWSDVQNGFGGTNTTVLFDLPQTE